MRHFKNAIVSLIVISLMIPFIGDASKDPKLPPIPKGKARIFFILLDKITLGSAKWKLDGIKIGKTKKPSWFYEDLEPGEYIVGVDGKFMGVTFKSNSIGIKIKAGDKKGVLLNRSAMSVILKEATEEQVNKLIINFPHAKQKNKD